MGDLVVLWILAAGIVIVALLGLREKKRYMRRLRKRILADFGVFRERKVRNDRIDVVSSYYRGHSRDGQVDDITWGDLELSRLFGVMNHTFSAAGEEYLYYALRTPLKDEEVLKKRDEQIRFFTEHVDERLRMQLYFARMGKPGGTSLYDYLQTAAEVKFRKGLSLHFLAPVLLLLSILLIFINTGTGIPVLIGALILNIGWYMRDKGTVAPYMICLQQVLREIQAGEWFKNFSFPVFEEETKTIRQSLRDLSGLKKAAVFTFSGDGTSSDPFAILGVYINMLLHLDLVAFYYSFRMVRNKKEAIDALHTAMGSLECMIALASFRKCVGQYCTPVLDGKQEAKGLAHPLIKTPVRNDYDLKESMLLTGSNASGKSTFLKAMAINMLLSRTFYMACAEEFHTDFSDIYTSMALRDDLAHQESYFMAEIRAMQRILQAGREKEEEGASESSHDGITCFVDEVLRGTNTVERIAASTKILEYMHRNGIRCIAATHDIELTDLLEDAGYENYHFDEEIREGDVVFPYKLKAGKAGGRNAIRLLTVMGYDEDITAGAQEMAERFTKEGLWRK